MADHGKNPLSGKTLRNYWLEEASCPFIRLLGFRKRDFTVGGSIYFLAGDCGDFREEWGREGAGAWRGS